MSPAHHRRTKQVLGALACALCSTVALTHPETSTARADARGLSRHPIAEDLAWRGYVLDSARPVAYPKAVTVTGGGSVENPRGLLEGGGGTTVHATGAGGPTVWLDLGLDTGGRIEVSITRTDGTPVTLAYAEARRFMTPSGDSTAGSLGNDDNPDGRSDTIAAAGPSLFVSPGVRGGERWIALRLAHAGTVIVGFVRVRVGSYRPSARDYVGRFLSSDRLLNRVWYDSVYTFNLDSVAAPGTPTVVVDGAKRDRLVWLGDLGLEAMTAAYSTARAPAIVRDSIDMFSCQQYADGYIAMASDIYVTCPAVPPPANGPPASTNRTQALIRNGRLPEYTAWWMIAEGEALTYWGDLARARGLLPVLRRAAGYFASNRDANGLFLTFGVVPINWHPFDVAYGEDTHTNATWVLALRELADVERLVGDPSLAVADEARADALAAAMRSHLWDAAAGAFVLNSIDLLRNPGQDGNVEAVLADVVSGRQAGSALDYIDKHLETPLGPLTGALSLDPFASQYISPYITSWELLARFRAGQGSQALSIVRRLFGYMANHDPGSTMWEKMTASGDPASYVPNQLGGSLLTTSLLGAGTTSLAHGWSTGPVPALSAYVLGLRPTSTAWKTWTVAPQPVDLRFAQGQVGTPHGTLVSRWQRDPRDRWFRITVLAPRGTHGTVAVPTLGATRTIARDGRVIWREGRPAAGVVATAAGDSVSFNQGPGPHTYAWSGPS